LEPPQKTTARIAGGVLIALLLGGCAGGQSLTTGGTANAQAPETGMAGRWILAAPNAPTCGVNFRGLPGAREGSVAPEGGCPGKFFLSRRWAFDQDALVINDDEGNALARLAPADGQYSGQAVAGFPVTLARPPAPPQQ
jgi:hypothetical protein